MLVPGLNYVFETFVECLSDKGLSDTVKVGIYSKTETKIKFCRNSVGSPIKYHDNAAPHCRAFVHKRHGNEN